MTDRDKNPATRNPVLGLESVKVLQALPPETRILLRQTLLEMALEARGKADYCWRKHKAPMAAYWKAVSVYAGHFAKALK